jgi:Ca-activated chloride channel family protein
MKIASTRIGLALAVTLALTSAAHAAGTLTPRGAPQDPIRIQSHHVGVVLNNGFARVEVTQTFLNPNDVDLEAVYSFPVPKSASLSEVTVRNGEREISGEVVEVSEAERVYEDERSQGNDAGLGRKNSYLTYEFRISPVRAGSEITLSFVYYEALELDHGVGRFMYPLEEGGTDECALSFWAARDTVEGIFAADLELKSSWPIADVRMPGFEEAARIENPAAGHYRIRIEKSGAALNRDLVLYYRLVDDLPGRVELLAYRGDRGKPGTFMMVLTPGVDLQPLTSGADYTFVLDVSGSMGGKIAALAQGVSQALGKLRPHDRFRIVTFSRSASELTRGWTAATPENVRQYIDAVRELRAHNSTNLYDGLSLALSTLDADRATSIILVTDAVTNTGIVDPAKFRELMRGHDLRLFGFVMGNSANWPLMRVICEASGGFSAGVSNNDDIIGQILLAKSKVTHEALHDVKYRIQSVRTFDSTDGALGKIYRGQQIVIFGRYAEGGRARVTLDARITGADKSYTTEFDFPQHDTENPELERLWAMNRIEAFEVQESRGEVDPHESRKAIKDLGIAYQIVTDYTSMLLLTDQSFARHGIERRNRERVAVERQAQAVRANAPARDRRVDAAHSAFPGTVPRVNGGGAIDPFTAAIVVVLAGLAAGRRRKKGVILAV